MKKILTIAAFVTAAVSLSAETTDTLVWRIKSMRCEECAHKVGTALRKSQAVESLDFNLERRTVTIAYDASKTNADSLVNRLRGTRYKPSAYNPNDTIHRGMGLYVADMHCQKCADRITNRISQLTGIDSIGPNLPKHYIFFRYDANRTSKSEIREALSDLGFTPVNYYTSKNISFAYFNIPIEKLSEETIETALSLDGVDDANISQRQRSLAITYVNTETNESKLLEGLRNAGIQAIIPAAHECKEEKK